MNTTSYKCGGKCCQRFMINGQTKGSLRESYNMWVARGVTSDHGLTKASNSHNRDGYLTSYTLHPIYADIHLIYPMLIDLGEHNWEPWNPRIKKKSKVQHWGCKHYDKKKGLCEIYDIRPQMCRSYPGPRGCLFEGCKHPGAKKVREKELARIKGEKSTKSIRKMEGKLDSLCEESKPEAKKVRRKNESR